MKEKASWLWREWIRPLLVVGLVLGSFRSAIADWNDVPTGSMKPTILEGDRVFVNKVAYDLRVPFTYVRLGRWADPNRGDIVVLISPHDGKRLVKRIIGIPGDTVELSEDRLIVNGRAATYAPADPRVVAQLGDDRSPTAIVETESTNGRRHAVMIDPVSASMPSFRPVTVPAGRYLVMGDNRDNSFDSRWFGFVERYRILGRVTAVVASVDLNHYFAPRWGRFFSPLR
jgi:signal peptidase I